MNGRAISVIVPTRNRVEALGRLLDSLAPEAEALAAEVVVVSDGSTDGTEEMLKRRRARFELVVVGQPNAGPAAARNAGVRAASGDLMVFLDDDVEAQPGLLALHAEGHCASAQRAYFGPLATPETELSPWAEWEQVRLERQYIKMATGLLSPTWKHFYTGNASVSRTAFDQVGGFDETYRRAEDIEFARRLTKAGVEIVFEPRAVVLHHVDRQLRSWLDNAIGGGAGIVRMTGDPTTASAFLAEEWRARHSTIRWLVRASAGRPANRGVQWALLALARSSQAVGLGRMCQLWLSATYNLAYFDSAARTLGGGNARFTRC